MRSARRPDASDTSGQVLVDRVAAAGTLPAEAALDAAVAGLARCGCR